MKAGVLFKCGSILGYIARAKDHFFTSTEALTLTLKQE